MFKRYVSLLALVTFSSFFYANCLAAEFESTYFGGANSERGQVVATGINGDIYIAGYTASNNLPGTSDTLKKSAANDIYVARFTKDMALVQAKYLNQTGSNIPSVLQSLKVNPITGELYLLAIWGDNDGGGRIIELSKELMIERMSDSLGIVGVGAWAEAYDLDVDEAGNVFVGGEINSDTEDNHYFANYTGVTHVYSEGGLTCSNGKTCAFVVKYSSGLSAISSVAIFEAGSKALAIRYNSARKTLYVVGEIVSSTMKGRLNSYNGGQDGFVASFSSDLSVLENSIYVGGDKLEGLDEIAFSADNTSLFVSGLSSSQVINSAASPLMSGMGIPDNFIAKLPLDLTQVEAYTFLHLPFTVPSKGDFGGAADFYLKGTRNSIIGVNPSTGDVALATYTDSPELSKLTDNFSTPGAMSLEVFRLKGDLTSIQKNVLIGEREITADGSAAFSASGTMLYVTGTTYSKQNFPKALNASGSLDTTTSDAVLIQMSGDYAIDDEDPDHFVFLPKKEVPLGKAVFSDPITVTNLSDSVAVSISGGAYWKAASAADKCEEDFAKYTKEVQTVKNGDVLCVGHVSANQFGVTNTTKLTVGSYSSDFVTTTENLRDYPDELTSDYYAKSVADQVVAWGVFPVNGINTPVTVSVVGGEYALNCTDRMANTNYTTASTANVVAGTSICIRHNAGNPGEHLVTNLTIGSRTFAFSSDAIDINKSSSDNGGGGGGGGSNGIFFAALSALLLLRKPCYKLN